jgi:hypothetical protein
LLGRALAHEAAAPSGVEPPVQGTVEMRFVQNTSLEGERGPLPNGVRVHGDGGWLAWDWHANTIRVCRAVQVRGFPPSR